MIGETKEDIHPHTSEATGSVSYAILDQALWQKFRHAGGPEEFVETWLAILCRQVPGAVAGVAVLGEPGTGPFSPVAYWPTAHLVGLTLSAVAEKAIEQRQGVVINGSGDLAGTRQIACPLIVDDQLYGVCAIAFSGSETAANDVMRKLQWGTGWIEVLLRRQMHADEQGQQERTGLAFDMLATVLENKRFEAASTALVTELAMRLRCDPVSIGFVRGHRCTVTAISHASGFGNKLSTIRDIGDAMDEAVDQRAVVLYPASDTWEYRVTLAHAELAMSQSAGSVLTLPLQSDHKIIGAITLQRPPCASFSEETVEMCDAVAALVGPVLEEKRRNDRLVIVKVLEAIGNQLRRLFGPRYFGRKLATAALIALAAYFSVAKDLYTITAPAMVEGTIQRTVVAPFNGYVASEYLRAGELVRSGEILARLDDQDLVLERIRLVTSREQRSTEYDRALAKHDRAEALIIKTQIDQADAQLALIDEQLARTSLVAPFDGVVVSGDLSQSIGASVERGQELFKIAPLDTYRVILEVHESDIEDVVVGQSGVLRVASIPDEPMTYRIERITSVSQQKDGRNFFRVEAALESVSTRLRPGMEGVAKTEIDERLLIESYTEKLIDWANLAIWRWLP
jgi:multidrug efflux pump subunit AcrA (membrane-fusion protein)